MLKMIKAVFFDVDGTLVSHTRGEVSVSTRKAVRQLKEKGYSVSLRREGIWGN